MNINRCKLYNELINELYDSIIDYDESGVLFTMGDIFGTEFVNEGTCGELFKKYSIKLSYERWYVLTISLPRFMETSMKEIFPYNLDDILENLMTKYPKYKARAEENEARLKDITTKGHRIIRSDMVIRRS